MSHELELKLELHPERVPQLERALRLLGKDVAGPKRVKKLVSTYFDTNAETLRSRGISFRIRRDGKRRLQTIKWAGRPDLFDRDQYETEIDGNEPDWEAARGTAIEPLLGKKLRRSLKPLFETRVRRTIYPIVTAGAEIELAVDSGSIHAGRRSAPIRELELEIKRGESPELFRFARELSTSVPVRLTLKSKAERGYELLNGAPPVAVKARTIELHAGTKLSAAFRIIARSCLGQIVSNEAGVLSRDSEALHQIRIGVRRLRAAISFFSDVVAGPQTALIKSELRWITRELSPARDLDVYIAEVLTPLREVHKDNADFRSLCRRFEQKRAEAFGRAVDAIGSDHYRTLLIELAAWIEAGAWSNPDDEATRGRNEQPIQLHAAEQLTRQRKKIVKKGKALDGLDDAQRHKLRIAVKKFRYAAEFVANAFLTKKSRKHWGVMLDSVKRIQDCLGALNDVIIHERLSLSVVDGDGKATAKLVRGRAFVAGLVSGQEKAKTRQLTEGAAAALAELGAVKAFWR